MDRGVTVGDYTVFIGKGICETAPGSLTTSTLLCNPPKPIPQKSADFDSKYHRIQVNVEKEINIMIDIWPFIPLPVYVCMYVCMHACMHACMH